MSSVSRRTFVLAGAALAGTLVAPPLEASAKKRKKKPVVRPTRPEGADYVRYEDLYRKGDTVGEALARLTQPKIVTFPEGKFECSDFNSGYQAGIFVPSICRGIVGSGRGTLGGSTGTVFTMKPRSSTKGNGASDPQGRRYVPVQDDKTPCQLNVIKQLDQRAPAVWRHFQVAGTEQGHLFSAFQVHNTAGRNRFEDLLITGWDGNSGAPPGETSALAVSGPGDHLLAGVECDGRRTPGGEVFGAMGLTVQNSVGAVLDQCYAHHCRASSFAAFQSVNGQLRYCAFDATVPADKAVGNGGLNFERTAGFTVVGCKITGRQRKVHITHSNDTWALNQGGRSYSVKDGSLTVVDPRYNDLWGNGLLTVQSWSPYWNGDSMRTPPSVTRSDARTKLPYTWVHDKAYLVK